MYAVGECAEHAGKIYGIVIPIFEQATVLADGADRPQAPGSLPRVEAIHPPEGGRDRGRLDGRHRTGSGDRRGHPGFRGTKVELPQADRPRWTGLIGAMLVGDVEAAANLVQLFDRGDPFARPTGSTSCARPMRGPPRTAGHRAIAPSATATRSAKPTIVESIKSGCCSLDPGARRPPPRPAPAADRAGACSRN